MFEVIWLSAHEILDSRGRPTLSVTVELASEHRGSASVPAGLSLGKREARELRDGDPSRFEGAGVRRAIAQVMGEIADLIRGRRFAELQELDDALIHLDGTSNKCRLGANSICGVSMAVARAIAAQSRLPLWRVLEPDGVTASLPMPRFNIVNGGLHARNALDFQEFMVVPLGAPSVAEAVRAAVAVHEAFGRRLLDKGLSALLADDGGYAPGLARPEDVLTLLVEAIEKAGYRAEGSDVAIALDVAASHFVAGDGYRLGSETLTSEELIDWFVSLSDRFPICSIEDGLAEDDWRGWEHLTQRLGDRLEIVGDDLFVTNPELILSGIDQRAANAALIKPNQVGTVTETLEAVRVCRQAGWHQVVSHRAGETDDPFIADLAVGCGCQAIKSGAPIRGEHVAKYNRLMEIEGAAFLSFGRDG